MQKSLINILPEELTMVEEIASYFFTYQEIATMLELIPSEVEVSMKSSTGAFYEAFQRGRLQSEMELRKSIIKLARAGSSPAQTMVLDLLNKSRLKMY